MSASKSILYDDTEFGSQTFCEQDLKKNLHYILSDYLL